MRLQAFKKGTLAAMLLLSGLVFTLVLAGCERESPDTKSTEAIKTGMTEKAETAAESQLAKTEAAATAEQMVQKSTEGVEGLARPGLEQTEQLAERGLEKSAEGMQAGAEKAEELASGMQEKLHTAGSEEALGHLREGVAKGEEAVAGQFARATGEQALDQARTQVEGILPGALAPAEGTIDAGKSLVSAPGEQSMPNTAPALSAGQSGECFAQVKIPPTFEMVTEQVLLPETGAYRTVTKKNLVAEGRMEQRAIVCEADIQKDLVLDIQSVLAQKGFDPGPIDGVIGPFTMKALNGYQKANNLPVDQHLNLATIKALGIKR